MPIIIRFGCWENDLENDLFGSIDGVIAEFLSSGKTSLGWENDLFGSMDGLIAEFLSSDKTSLG